MACRSTLHTPTMASLTDPARSCWPGAMHMSASRLHRTSACSKQRTGSHPHTLRVSSAPLKSAPPSSEKRTRRTCPLSGGVHDTCSKLSKSHRRRVRSAAALAIRNSVGCTARAVTGAECCVNSCTSLGSTAITSKRAAVSGARDPQGSAGGARAHLPIVRSHSLTIPSSPPETTQRPSGEKTIWRTPFEWPLYVWMHDLRRMSQILRFVSTEPDAKNSP